MQLLSKFNKGFRFLLCGIDVYSKYAWVDKGSEFYSRSMKSWLEKDAIEVYSTNNERKSVIAERCIRILKNKIYKCDFSFKKCLY